MEFDITRREPEKHSYEHDVLEVAYDFSKLVHKELGDIVRAIVLFGSATKKDNPHDIDILIIIDDIHVQFTQDLQQAYQVIVGNAVQAVSKRLHVTTLRFSNFWEYVRTADPVVTTVLRDGRAILDTGFFSPLQLLLQQGRIRPSSEAIWAYYAKAPQVLVSSKWKVMLAVVDLYWAVIDSAHAALMRSGVVPQTPEHVSGLLNEKFVQKGLLDARFAHSAKKFYDLQKDVYSRRIESISGARYDKLHQEAQDFVSQMRTLIE